MTYSKRSCEVIKNYLKYKSSYIHAPLDKSIRFNIIDFRKCSCNQWNISQISLCLWAYRNIVWLTVGSERFWNYLSSCYHSIAWQGPATICRAALLFTFVYYFRVFLQYHNVWEPLAKNHAISVAVSSRCTLCLFHKLFWIILVR
jgi:hypothetical protein